MKTVKKYYLQVYHHSLSTGPEREWIDISSLEIHPELAERLAELGILEFVRTVSRPVRPLVYRS